MEDRGVVPFKASADNSKLVLVVLRHSTRLIGLLLLLRHHHFDKLCKWRLIVSNNGTQL